jgi:hypothetical protein
MAHYKKTGRSTRRGKIIALTAFALTGIVGYAAIATDGGLFLENRRQVQAAADEAAMAAAIDLFTKFIHNQGIETDTNGTAHTRAREAATAAGFTQGVNGVTVTVNIPPLSGDHVGMAGHAEVIITYPQPRYFSQIFGSSSTTLTGRAVARGRLYTSKVGIIVLDLTVAEALKVNGNGTATVTGADIINNSNNSLATGGDGTGAVLKVVGGSFDLVGGVKPNTILQGPVTQLPRPVPDPLAYLPEPALPANAITVHQTNTNSAVAQPYLTALGLSAASVGKLYILDPGRYDNLPNFTNQDVVILNQASAGNSGIYYLNGSGFTTNGATVVMDPTGATTGGVMLYNNPGNGNSAGININGGVVNLSPPTSGIYKGMEIFQERSSTVTLQIAGQGSTNISGTFYAAGAGLKITGSSLSGVDVIGSQYISDTLQSGGNGQYTVNWQPQLTTPIRQLAIVE